MGRAWRWCMDATVCAMYLFPHGLCCGNLAANGLRACGGQHAVAHRHADRCFGLLSIGMASPQTRANQRLVAAHPLRQRLGRDPQRQAPPRLRRPASYSGQFVTRCAIFAM